MPPWNNLVFISRWRYKVNKTMTPIITVTYQQDEEAEAENNLQPHQYQSQYDCRKAFKNTLIDWLPSMNRTFGYWNSTF